MTKFAVDLGHNVRFDGGAKGVNKSENQLIMEVGSKVIKKLRNLGHEVVECLPKSANSLRDSLHRRTRQANNHNCDVFVSIHFNAYGQDANGTEVLYISPAGKRIGEPVLAEIAKLGFRNRGMKYRTNLHVLRATRMPAILVECCFSDSWTDMNRFNSEKMADAIVKGLTGKVPNSPPSPPSTCKC